MNNLLLCFKIAPIHIKQLLLPYVELTRNYLVDDYLPYVYNNDDMFYWSCKNIKWELYDVEEEFFLYFSYATTYKGFTKTTLEKSMFIYNCFPEAINKRLFLLDSFHNPIISQFITHLAVFAENKHIFIEKILNNAPQEYGYKYNIPIIRHMSS
jgi:hypothetical protein